MSLTASSKMTGAIIGSVTFRVTNHPDAPSTAAES
jgi:hypothetical protein